MADDYEVGYGRPPRDTRFRKGQSGNPKGRPKGSKNVATVFLEEMRRLVVVREGGKTRRIGKQEALVTSLWNKAIKGDIRAVENIPREELDLLAEELRAVVAA